MAANPDEHLPASPQEPPSPTEPMSPSESKHSLPAYVLIGLLLCAHAVVAFDAARRMSVTHDEYWHLPVGLLNLKTGRFGFDTLNPPLIRMWAAVPLLAASAASGPTDQSLDAVEHGDAFLRANLNDYDRYLTLGRAMIVLLSLLTAVGLALWAKRLFGNAAACLAVLLWVACPNVAAHASLVTTDLAAALFFVWTLFLLWRYADRPSWSRAAGLGVCLGLAQLAKYTSLVLYPMCLVLWFVHRTGNAGVRQKRSKTLLAQWALLLALSLTVLNAGYLFRGSFASLGSYRFGSQTLIELSDRLQPLHALPVPLPRDYVVGVDQQNRIMESRHPVYLDGEWNTQGFSHYYLMALWYKLPHATQWLTLLAIVFLLAPAGESRRWRCQIELLLPAAMLLAIAGSSGMQLGLRYVLPALPFLFLFAAQSARWLQPGRYRWRAGLILIVVAVLPLSLRHHPHHLAYFNELAGGPAGGRSHLVDSNLDWGQDLRGLRDYLAQNPVGTLGLAYFGPFPPGEIGIDYRLPPSHAPQPGWYAVSVNFVQGRPHTLRDPAGEFHAAGLDEFGYFRAFSPVARIGYSIELYHLRATDVAEWRARMRARMQ